MREDSLRTMIAFFFRHIWVICALLISINFVSTFFSARSIMESTAQEGLTSLATEMGHRIDVNYKLLESLKTMPHLGDTSIPVEDRAASLKAFASAFGLWMIGVVDPDGMISSTLSYDSSRVTRDYIPRILQSARREMSDVFPAGATGDLNFSQFVPVVRQGKVVSIIFTSMLVTDIDAVLARRSQQKGDYYLLIDSKLQIISHPMTVLRHKDLNDLTKQEKFWGDADRDRYLQNLRSATPGSFLSWFDGTLLYSVYTCIPDTQWTLLHRIKVVKIFSMTFIGFIIQSIMTIFVFSALYFIGTSYVSKILTPSDNILKQVIDLNNVIHNTNKIKSEDTASILYLSQKGLCDELTELPTRMLFRQTLNQRMRELASDALCAVYYIDMDNLKNINETFGHEYGDMALAILSKSLRTVAEQHDGLCARYGGDEFVLFVENLPNEDAALAIAQELSTALHGTVAKGTEELPFYVSIGAALYPLHAKNIDVVLQLADIALYEVKQNGTGRCAFYSQNSSDNLPSAPIKTES